MKTRFDKRWVASAVGIASMALMAGCGSNNAAPVVPGVTGGIGIGGGCAPIATSPLIGFTATNMYLGNPYINGDSRVLAGIVPPGDEQGAGTYGTMMVTAGNVAPPVQTAYGAPVTFQSQHVNGTSLSMTVTGSTLNQPVPMQGNMAYGQYPNSYGAYPGASGQVNSSGYIQLSSTLQQLLIQAATGTYGTGGYGGIISPMGAYPQAGYPGGAYPMTNMGQICVSNLAFSLKRTNPSFANWLYQGYIYFYLSGGIQNGQHGLRVYF